MTNLTRPGKCQTCADYSQIWRMTDLFWVFGMYPVSDASSTGYFLGTTLYSLESCYFFIYRIMFNSNSSFPYHFGLLLFFSSLGSYRIVHWLWMVDVCWHWCFSRRSCGQRCRGRLHMREMSSQQKTGVDHDSTWVKGNTSRWKRARLFSQGDA